MVVCASGCAPQGLKERADFYIEVPPCSKFLSPIVSVIPLQLIAYRTAVILGRDPDKPVTKKPAETRMGSGKGSPEYWVAVVKPGRILFEIAEVDEATAREALRLAGNKLPIRCKFVKREDETVKEGDAE